MFGLNIAIQRTWLPFIRWYYSLQCWLLQEVGKIKVSFYLLKSNKRPKDDNARPWMHVELGRAGGTLGLVMVNWLIWEKDVVRIFILYIEKYLVLQSLKITSNLFSIRILVISFWKAFSHYTPLQLFDKLDFHIPLYKIYKSTLAFV